MSMQKKQDERIIQALFTIMDASEKTRRYGGSWHCNPNKKLMGICRGTKKRNEIF